MKRIDDFLVCPICSIRCSSQKNFESHIKGRKHRKNLQNSSDKDKSLFEQYLESNLSIVEVLYSEKQQNKRYLLDHDQYYCEKCKIEIIGADEYYRHLRSEKHDGDVDEETGKENEEHVNDDRNNNSENQCLICDVRIESSESYRAHMAGAKHKKMVKRIEIIKELKKNNFNVDEKRKKDEKSPYYCSICDIECGSINNLNAHIYGGKHKRKERLLNAKKGSTNEHPFYCSVCDIQCSSELDYHIHSKGRLHTNKERMNTNMGGKSTNNSGNRFYCKVCEIQCSSPEDYRIHSTGRKHKNRARMLQQGNNNEPLNYNSFYCKTCNVQCSSPEDYRIHSTGRKHKNNIKSNEFRKKLRTSIPSNPLENCDNGAVPSIFNNIKK